MYKNINMKTTYSKLIILLLASIALFGCTKESATPLNPLKGTIWSHETTAVLTKEPYSYFIEFTDDKTVNVWDSYNSYAGGSGTYTLSGNEVKFSGLKSTYWKVQYTRATFTSTSMTVYYKYIYAQGGLTEEEYKRVYIKK